MQVTAKKLPDLLIKCMNHGITPMIHGSPGIGKSDIIRTIADKNKLKVIDLRLSQSDPTDLSGFPSINNEAKKASYKPMDTFPLSTDKIPEGFNGWLLFLDEINSAPISVQAAAYKIILDRAIGTHNLHSKCFVAAAGNLTTDKAIVNRMSTAMQSRMAHFELTVDNDAWLEWADEHGIDHRIMSYIRFKPEALYNFNPDHSDYTYASPRTWEFTDRMIRDKELDSEDIPLLVSVIGEGTGIEFKGYTDIYRDLPTAKSIIDNPTGTELSTEPSMLYAISGFIPTFITEKNIDDVMIYIHRMPKEFQFIALKQVVGANKKLMKVPVIINWIKTLSKEYRDVII